MFFLLMPNVFEYGKLRVCERGLSEVKSEASKRVTNFGLAKICNFLYTVCQLHKFAKKGVVDY